MSRGTAERRPAVVLGSPIAILLAGVICLLAAGIFPYAVHQHGSISCGLGGPCSTPIVYVAYPLIYVGWLLLFLGGGVLVYGLFLRRTRPSLSYMDHESMKEWSWGAGYVGVEEPALPPRYRRP